MISKREETEEEEVVDMGGWGSEIEESKRSSVDIDNILNPDEAPAHRIPCLEVIQSLSVVTRFGRVAKVGYLEKQDALRGWSVTRGKTLPNPGYYDTSGSVFRQYNEDLLNLGYNTTHIHAP